MITVRKAAARGTTRLSWLDSRHTFSFNAYLDPDWMGFGPLRVINDDVVAPGGGFGTHGHRDMEILSFVVEGALEHRDSLGNGSVVVPGEVQRMSAGTGIRHSEFNPSLSEPSRFLQVWIEPDTHGLPPSYEQRAFAGAADDGAAVLVASRDGRDGSLTIHQDASVYTASLAGARALEVPLAAGRAAWVQVVSGTVAVNGIALSEGDGAALAGEAALRLTADSPTRTIVFDLPE
ncbi:MAG: pirin family protein [Acidobacteriota bacterium]